MSLKIKVKASNEDAKRVAEALQHLPSKEEVRRNRTPNYVSNDALFIPSGANSDKQKGSSTLPHSTQEPRPGEARQDRTEAEYIAHAFPEPTVNPVDAATEATTVKPTSCGGAYDKLPPNHPEHQRQANNRARDAKVNLGRGKRGIID